MRLSSVFFTRPSRNCHAANACSLASLRALFLMVGTLPSRTLVQMSPHDNTLPSAPKSADSFQLACILPTDFFGAAVQKPRRLRRNFLSVVWSKTVFAPCCLVTLLQTIPLVATLLLFSCLRLHGSEPAGVFRIAIPRRQLHNSFLRRYSWIRLA